MSSSSRIGCTKFNINQGESGEERKEETEASTRREIVAFFACDTISSNSSVLKIRNGSFHDDKDIKIEQNRKRTTRNETHDGSSWDIIAVTSKYKSHAQAFVEELRLHTDMEQTLTIPVSDLDGKSSMGSGGATLHALVQIVGETLSSCRRFVSKRRSIEG